MTEHPVKARNTDNNSVIAAESVVLATDTPEGPIKEIPIHAIGDRLRLKLRSTADEADSVALGSETPEAEVKEVPVNVTGGHVEVRVVSGEGSIVLATETLEGEVKEIPVGALGKRAKHLRFHRHAHLGVGRS